MPPWILTVARADRHRRPAAAVLAVLAGVTAVVALLVPVFRSLDDVPAPDAAPVPWTASATVARSRT